jgi:nucleotidyltransferase substrate binding protein (TIGR01987 family)
MTSNQKEIRWRQRFQNFDKAFKQLKNGLERLDSLDNLAKEGLIQRFEYTLELAWKTLKDYLEANEVITNFPKEVIRQSYKTELIKDGDIWMEMLQNRNLLAHTYDEEVFNISIDKISRIYFQEIETLHSFFVNLANNDNTPNK